MPSDDDAEFLKHEQPIVARPRCHPPETNAEAHLKVFVFFVFYVASVRHSGQS